MILDARHVDPNRDLHVFMNGIEITQDCFKVDTERGIAWIYVRDPSTMQFKRSFNTPITRELRGEVKVQVGVA